MELLSSVAQPSQAKQKGQINMKTGERERARTFKHPITYYCVCALNVQNSGESTCCAHTLGPRRRQWEKYNW